MIDRLSCFNLENGWDKVKKYYVNSTEKQFKYYGIESFYNPG